MKQYCLKRFPVLLTLLFLMCYSSETKATHYMGGEITWECTPQGNFRFTMILYRECYTQNGGNAAIFGNTVNMQTNHPSFATIQMNRVLLEDMSPQCSCPGGHNIYCPGMSTGAANMGAMQKNVYTSDAAYPNGVPLTGVPPATGWWFRYGVCCRNPCHNIQNSASLQFLLRAFMYPYQNTPVNNCFDNSPQFLEKPAAVFCSGSPQKFINPVYEPDQDSLVFEWATPLSNNINSPITTYFPGYSYQSPLPDTMHNPNNTPAVIDPVTGNISFTTYTNGAFLVVIKITSYKSGIKVSEIFRELQIVVLPCQANSTPVVQPILNLTPIAPDHYHASVTLGDTVSFAINITDTDTCPGSLQPNSVILRAYGEQFGNPVNLNPCPNPPCAYLTPPPTPTTPLTMQANLNTTFEWVIGTAHLEYANGMMLPKTHTFVFQYQDNHCPVPATGTFKVTVEVSTPFQFSPTELNCVEVWPNGNVLLHWEPNTIPASGFQEYQVIASSQPQGPFLPLGSLPNISSNAFLHTGGSSLTQQNYYRLNTRILATSSFDVLSQQVASSIYLTLQPDNALNSLVHLNWNPTHQMNLPNATGVYEIHRKDNAGNWTMIGTTTAVQYTDTIPFQNQQVDYRVETVVTTPGTTNPSCRSVSNPATTLLSSTPENVSPENTPFIFPNPTQRDFVLNPGYLNGPATLSILTLNGTSVVEQELFFTSAAPCTIETPDLPAGIYLVLITNKTKTFTTKLIVQ